MRCALAVIIIPCCSILASGQGLWQASALTDPLRGTKYTQFTLKGIFVTPPRQPTESQPSLVVECMPGKRLRVYGGTFLTGYLSTGTVLNSVVVQHDSVLGGTSYPSAVLASFRLDDGKIKQEYWSPSTDGTGAFFKDVTLNTLLYGHFLPHKPNTSPPVRKVVIGINEYLASEVVVQFDMPDPREVADACGGLYHNR